MKNKIMLFMLFASLCVLPACSFKSGNEAIRTVNTENLKEIITINKTTKNDISAHFGQPTMNQSNHDGTTIWNYHFSESTQSGMAYVPIAGLFAEHKSEGKSLVIIFNQNDTVKSYSISDIQHKGSIL